MSVHTERSGPVTTIIMERRNVRNAVDPASTDALVAAFETFNSDPQANGAGTLAEAIQGAGRFASGKGRHGAFDDI